ncbi:MAG: tetratricopeptide repeat protein, partial [Deltaproteobacteria bacterium]|nr:tetratricopeptide repeat protein [Deltaproteobacteria bacterium]
MRFHCGLIWTGISLVLAGCSPLPGLVEIDQAPPERLAEIEQVLSRTLVQDPGNVGALIRLAKVNVRQGNGQAAVEYAGRAGHLKPFNASALILMGQGYQLMGRHIQAQEVLAQAVALEPARMEAYPYLARSQAQTGRSELALKTLDAALRRNPGFTLAWEAKAALLVEAAREKEAQAALNSALVLEPDSEVLQTIQVDLLIARGLLSLAAFMVEEALASHKESPLWLERLAALQRQRGEWSDLLSTLDQLQTVTLLEPRVLLWQEEALRHVNRHSEAQALLTRLQNTYGEFPPLRLRSAQRNMEAGDLKKALEDLDRYQELNPRNYASHLLKAALFFRLNRTPEGVQALE